MSVQFFLHGKITGTEQFLGQATGIEEFLGRARWLSLIAEVLPRGIISEVGLSKMLVGASGGDQFLIQFPEEYRERVFGLLEAAAGDIQQLTGGIVRLIWSATEDLGSFIDIRKRLEDEMTSKANRAPEATTFDPFEDAPVAADQEYFAEFGRAMRTAHTVGWSAERPGRVLPEGAWTLEESASEFAFARHVAESDEEARAATVDELAARAQGDPQWGVLRADVDNSGIRFRRAQTAGEYIQHWLSLKEFFARELQLGASIGENWRKVTVIRAAGDEFAICGAWDTLIGLGREMQRLFRRFADEVLKDLPGPEGKTLTAALVIAAAGEGISDAYVRAGKELEVAKAADKDVLRIFGRNLEWKQVAEAGEIKDAMQRLLVDFGVSPQLLSEVASLYSGEQRGTGKRSRRLERPWMIHARIHRAVPARDRELQRARTAFIRDLIGRSTAQARLRPAGRVALEWARLAGGR